MPIQSSPESSLPDPEPCCRPDDVPAWVWAVSQTMPRPWQTAGGFVVVAIVAFAVCRPRPEPAYSVGPENRLSEETQPRRDLSQQTGPRPQPEL